MMEGCVGEEWRRWWKEWKRIERVGVCSWLIEVSLLSDGGFAGDTQTSPQPIFMTLNPPMPPSLVHSLHPPLPCLEGPRATWVGCSDLYLCACVCIVWVCDVMKLSHRLHLGILQTHYQPIGIPDYRHKAASQYIFMYKVENSIDFNYNGWKKRSFSVVTILLQ